MESQDSMSNTELENDLQTGTPDDASPPEVPSRAPPPVSQAWKIPLIAGIAIVVALLCGVCLVGTILWTTGVLSIPARKQAAPQLMPAAMAFFASVNVDVEDTAGYKHLTEVYDDVPEVEDAWDDFLGQMKKEFDVSYKDDIKPWLGPELAMGITNMDDVLNGEDPVAVIAAGTRDTKASDAFLDKMLAYLVNEGYDVNDETYQKVDYYVVESENEPDKPLVLGTVKKFVILTMDKGAMEDVIDAAKNKSDSLADNERYTEVMGTLPRDAAAYMFCDMEDLRAGLSGLQKEHGTTELELPRQTTEQFEAVQAAGSALRLDREGVQLDFAATFDPDALSPEMLESFDIRASANRILKRIPGDVVGFLSGQNLAAVWKSALASLAKVPGVKEQLGDLGIQLNLDSDEGLLDWLPGEFAIALIEARAIEGLAEAPIGGFAVFEVDDRQEAESTLQNIIGLLEALGHLEFDTEEIGDVEMQVVTDPDSEEIVLGVGFIDKHLIIGFTQDALEAAADDDFDSIAGDDTFKKVQKHLPSKVGGYLYVNVKAALGLAYKNMSKQEQEEFDASARPFLEPITALGLAALPTNPRKGISKGTLFLYIPGE